MAGDQQNSFLGGLTLGLTDAYSPMTATYTTYCGCSGCKSRDREIEYLRNRIKEESYRFRPYDYPWEYGYPSWFEFSKPKKMKTLSAIAKKVFDADTRTLVKAGILDESLEITEEGTSFLLAQYLADNKKALALEAKKLLDEKKEDKA